LLAALKSLNRWAFSKAPKLSDSVDNDFAALGFIGGADLVAALIGVCLGKGVDSDAKSEGDGGVVEDHIEECCNVDVEALIYLKSRKMR
jgi:hypothetical protein